MRAALFRQVGTPFRMIRLALPLIHAGSCRAVDATAISRFRQFWLRRETKKHRVFARLARPALSIACITYFCTRKKFYACCFAIIEVDVATVSRLEVVFVIVVFFSAGFF
uniref:hypothetical protein n=1 Tax=Stappia sp. TaxID=1870903 RepID=UPI003BAB29C4